MKTLNNPTILIKLPTIAIIGCVLLMNTPLCVMAETVDRGQLLYENHCTVCHESTIHIREQRKVKTLIDLSRQVIRWQYEQKLNWQYEDIIQVTQYLNRRYYKLRERPIAE